MHQSSTLIVLNSSQTEKQIPQVIHELTQTSPSQQHRAIETYFTPDAAFTHPFCRTGSFNGSRILIRGIYRWYKIMSPEIKLRVNSVGALTEERASPSASSKPLAISLSSSAMTVLIQRSIRQNKSDTLCEHLSSVSCLRHPLLPLCASRQLDHRTSPHKATGSHAYEFG